MLLRGKYFVLINVTWDCFDQSNFYISRINIIEWNNSLYPALVLFEHAYCIDRKKKLYAVTDRNIAFSGTRVTCNLLVFGNLVVNPVHFLLTAIIKRGNQGIIIHFYFLMQIINVDGLM